MMGREELRDIIEESSAAAYYIDMGHSDSERDQRPGERVWRPARAPLSGLRASELINEVQHRMERAIEGCDRLHGLMEAMLAVASGLELEQTLRTIVCTATRLLDARYGALAVRGPGGEVVDFIHEGIDEATRDKIGPLPRGRGVFGAFIDERHPIILEDIGAHRDSVGFPANHPPMDTLLVVPVMVRGEVFGQLYLAGKSCGELFGEDDGIVAQALAAAAGIAVENARRYRQSEHRRRWVEATGDIVTALLSGAEPAEMFQLIAHEAHVLTDAMTTLVAVPDDPAADHDEVTDLRIVAATGDVPGIADRVTLSDGPLRAAFRRRLPHRCAAAELPGALGAGAGCALVLPLRTQECIAGLLIVLQSPERHACTDEQLEAMVAFADRTTVAWKFVSGHRKAHTVDIAAGGRAYRAAAQTVISSSSSPTALSSK